MPGHVHFLNLLLINLLYVILLLFGIYIFGIVHNEQIWRKTKQQNELLDFKMVLMSTFGRIICTHFPLYFPAAWCSQSSLYVAPMLCLSPAAFFSVDWKTNRMWLLVWLGIVTCPSMERREACVMPAAPVACHFGPAVTANPNLSSTVQRWMSLDVLSQQNARQCKSGRQCNDDIEI